MTSLFDPIRIGRLTLPTRIIMALLTRLTSARASHQSSRRIRWLRTLIDAAIIEVR